MALTKKLSKVTVAKSQLETALVLFFYYDDYVSIHTLVAASSGILEAVASSKGIVVTAKQNIVETIRPNSELLKRFYGAWNMTQNNLKHADRDTDVCIDYAPHFTEFHLYEAVCLYAAITGELFSWGVVYKAWFVNKYRESFIDTYPELDELLGKLGKCSDDKSEWIEIHRDYQFFSSLAQYML